MQWGFSSLGFNFNILNALSHTLLVFFLRIWGILLHFSLDMMYLSGLPSYESLKPMIENDNSATLSAKSSAIIGVIIDSIKETQVIQIIITISVTISVAFILIKYGYVIFRTYFLNISGQSSAPTMDFFKRVMVSLLLAFVVPIVTINGFIGTAILSDVAIREMFFEEEKDVNALAHMQYLYDHKKYGISPITYCYNERAQSTFGGNSFQGLNRYSFPRVLKENGSNPGEKELWERYCAGELKNTNYDKSTAAYMGIWSKQQPAMVAQTLLDSEIDWPVDYKIYLLEDTSSDTNFSSDVSVDLPLIVFCLVSTIFSLGVIYRLSQLLANLISSLLMFWYYVQDYISVSHSHAFGMYMKKIFSIFLSMFYILMMYAIFIKYISTIEGFDILFLVISIVLWKACKNGSMVISDIFVSTKPLGMSSKISGALKRV